MILPTEFCALLVFFLLPTFSHITNVMWLFNAIGIELQHKFVTLKAEGTFYLYGLYLHAFIVKALKKVHVLAFVCISSPLILVLAVLYTCVLSAGEHCVLRARGVMRQWF